MSFRVKVISVLFILVILSGVGTGTIAVREFLNTSKNELYSQSTATSLSLALIAKHGLESFMESMPVYSRFGVALVDTSTRRVVSGNNKFQLPHSFVEQILKTPPQHAVITRELDYAGETILVSISPVEKKYLVLVHASARSIYSLSRSSLQRFAFFGVVVTILVLISAFFFSRRFILSVEKLRAATHDIASGERVLTIDIHSGDEIGELARSFEQMGDSLGKRERQVLKLGEDLALSEKLASLGRFSAGIAHEIKNPLTSILANVQLVKRKLMKSKEGSSLTEFLEMVEDDVYRSVGIISDITSFSRQDKLNFSPTNLQLTLEGIISTNRQKLDQAGVSLNVSLLCKEMVKLDGAKFTQVIENFFSNSMDALQHSELKEIELSLSVEGEKLVLDFCDTGPGVSAEDQKKIFDPFYTTKIEGKGTGLGLSICYSIIAQHSGSLTYLNDRGGAHFRIELPLIA